MTPAEARLYAAHLLRIECDAVRFDWPARPGDQERAAELADAADAIDAEADAMGVDRRAAWDRWAQVPEGAS